MSNNIENALHAIRTGDAVGFKSAITSEIQGRAELQVSNLKMEVAASLFDDNATGESVDDDSDV